MTSSNLQKEWHAAAGVNCTERRVRNRLLEAGLKSCKARKKPFINEKQRRARLKFAKDHKDWTVEDWSKVVFSDECNFQLCETPSHVMNNAPCHTAGSIKVWMRDHQNKTISWPAQSPDLNPTENLWNVIQRKMDGHKPSNKAELLEFLCQEWCKVTQQQCERLVEIMPRCMKGVIKNQGYSTKS
ncbi:hypothetical protein P4O66_013265 [Electrophorus voltai]|uniref:Transposase Tc1-like domain-containing protein n=1 Tax=Electrophorus voltai TaxID=2609070 RepID=A0AAD8Z2K9_9TELE|nr:hypothetical protein P4O66_013265 [Electrophorus voltai]